MLEKVASSFAAPLARTSRIDGALHESAAALAGAASGAGAVPAIEPATVATSGTANPRSLLDLDPLWRGEGRLAVPMPAGAGERSLFALVAALALHAALLGTFLSWPSRPAEPSPPEAIAVEVVVEAPPKAQAEPAASPSDPSSNPAAEPRAQAASDTPPAVADPPPAVAEKPPPEVEPSPAQVVDAKPPAMDEAAPPPPAAAAPPPLSPVSATASRPAGTPPPQVPETPSPSRVPEASPHRPDSEPALAPAERRRPPLEIKTSLAAHPQKPVASPPNTVRAAKFAEKPAPKPVEAAAPLARSKAPTGNDPKSNSAQAQGSGASGSAASSAASAAYQGAVLAAIAAHKRYPEAALGRGPRGVSVVSFTIGGGGQVVSAQLARSAGDAALDADAVATVRRASPFPPPPAGAPRRFAASLNYMPR